MTRQFLLCSSDALSSPLFIAISTANSFARLATINNPAEAMEPDRPVMVKDAN
jgi:hypothetical protein